MYHNTFFNLTIVERQKAKNVQEKEQFCWHNQKKKKKVSQKYKSSLDFIRARRQTSLSELLAEVQI